MNKSKPLIQAILAAVLALGLSATALADKRTENTLIGAGLGGVAGALLSASDPLITLGGAAAGGVLGNVLTEDDRDRRHRHWKQDRGRDHGYQRANYRGYKEYRGDRRWHRRHHR